MKKNGYVLDEKCEIEYNGEKYFLRIRSNDTDKPIVLFLHGGPGLPDRALIMEYLSSLADICVIAAWDQRGAGLAYDKHTAKTESLTKELYVKDTVNVINYLRERFKKDKIILVGHSFGSLLGVWIAKEYPELLQAYVGIGQFIDTAGNREIGFRYLMSEAEKRKDSRAIKKLEIIGPPVNGYFKRDLYFTRKNYLNKYGGSVYASDKGIIAQYMRYIPLYIKEYGLARMVRFFKGMNCCMKSPVSRERENFTESAKELEIPVYLLLGHHDYDCSFELAEKWFYLLKAPYKRLVWFERSAHIPQFEETKLWCETFKKEVLENTNL